ncbi:hypothetical protein GK091_25715 [Spirosoma agri]|uniref:DUF5703 domain-containing protein n=1 Tax=Spirosoma agri TaxID=1987381 RepID=A0A6M0IPN7_9BACT|nr:hypothetical protein [Spirosoma agri]
MILVAWGLLSPRTFAQSVSLAPYNVVWTTQSANSGESMPCGGGDIGLNVWVEKGDLLLYVSRSGTFDENNALLKLGRLRLHLNPNPFTPGYRFRQELHLQEGYVRVTGQRGGQVVQIIIWVDVFRPVVHLDLTSHQPLIARLSYENWRTQDRLLAVNEGAATSYKTLPNLPIVQRRDQVAFMGNVLHFYHRNQDSTVFDYTVKQQGLTALKDSLWNPLHQLTFGGDLRGTAMIADGSTIGVYQNTPFTGWHLKSRRPTRSTQISLVLHQQQTPTLADWQRGLEHQRKQADQVAKTARSQSQAWWHQFWNRSYIVIQPDKADSSAIPWQIGRNYQLFRYMLGCNAYGSYPTKFNGGLFTYDPVWVKPELAFSPDFRAWGGGTFTAQNQRLVYWPLLKSGDVDLMKPQFEFYRRTLPTAEQRSRFYWGHGGACFSEQLENFGLPQAFEYLANQYVFKTQRPPTYDKGVEFNNWLAYTWDTVLEFCLMILDAERFSGQDIAPYLPLIDSSVRFFDEHYQQAQRQRSTKSLDEQGHFVLYPGSAAETYKTTYNAITTVAGLRAVLSRLLALSDRYIPASKRSYYEAMLSRVPPIPTRIMQGHRTLAPAQAWERINNVEIPQLYPVFPYNLYGLGKPDFELALNTWQYDSEAAKVKDYVGWKQDNIFCARLGLTNEAARLTEQKLGNSARRFPAFWGPGFDWTPDHNWGGSGMIGLQEMLMQTDGRTIQLLPAWPRTWDVVFRLHAPYQTVVEGRVVNGKLEQLRVSPPERARDVVLPGN